MPNNDKPFLKYCPILNPDINAPIYVLDLGHEKCKPNHVFGPAVRKHYLIHLIKSGKGTVERKGNIVHLKAGDSFVIRPNEVVTYKADENEPWDYFWIGFSGSYSTKIMEETSANLFPVFRKSGLLSLENATQMTSFDTIGTLEILFDVLNSIKSTKNEKTDFISVATNYIETNYARTFDITLLAKTLNVSRSHFTTVFTHKVGETPHAYLSRIRIEKAKDFLTTTSLSITEIAYSVGFSSLERFSDAFKNQTGLSPKNFRNSTT